jgi:hypothetical protein
LGKQTKQATTKRYAKSTSIWATVTLADLADKQRREMRQKEKQQTNTELNLDEMQNIMKE